jgi:DNA topoisomerase-1
MRDEVKFNKLAAFGEVLPRLRSRVDEDLSGRKWSREKVVALVLRLLDESLIRVGNNEYAAENGSYGLTTLQKEHLAVNGRQLIFSFPGKSGKQQEVVVKDRRLARLVGKCQELPGQTLFQYYDENEEYRPISSTDVNEYLREVTGEAFTAKDFRTWGATVTAAAELAKLGPAESDSAAQKNIIQAVKAAANALGNTPAVCRQYYVHPAVGEAYLSGDLSAIVDKVSAGKLRRKEGLTEMETAVLALLNGS